MKFNTSLIEGYDKMSAEDKIKALEAFEIDDHATDIEKLTADNKKQKELIDKYTSEISSLKKEQSSHLTEAEKEKLERDKEFKSLQEKYEALESAQKKAEYSKNLIKQGYSEELADEKAEALMKGDMAKVFECESKFNEAQAKKIKADLVKDTKGPNDKGDPKKPLTRDDILKIKDPIERQKAIAENLEVFSKKEN